VTEHSPETQLEMHRIVEQYQDVLPALVQDAVNAGAFVDCAAAVDTLLPYLREAGTERLAVLTAVALIRLAQSWQREGVTL
jgi:hypothetical protein